MSILRNIAVGALSEGINQMEQKDRMYAEIAVDAGKNYFQNVLPKSIEAENFRKSTYDKIYSITGDRNFTELMDRDGFTTQKNGVELAQELYKNIDKEKLKAATFQTSYEDRYNQRIKSRDEMYQPMLKELGFGIGAMGPNIMKSLVEEDFVKGKDTQTAKKPTEAADMTQQTGMKDTDVTQAPAVTISDFLISKPVTYQLPEGEFAKVAQGYGFNEMINFNEAGDLLSYSFSTVNERVKYNALRSSANKVAANFIDQGKKVNVGQAVEEGAKLLNQQVHGTYRDAFGESYKRKTQDEFEEGKGEYKAQGYTKNFNDLFPTDTDKQAYFKEKLITIGDQSEQRYFALSAPEVPIIVVSRDGTKTRSTTLREYLLSLVPTAF
jgi:hypothetical protein